jgi:hypothetical protein
MKHNDVQVGLPETFFKGTKTVIEAIANPVEGWQAYATDTHLNGYYNGSSWIWGTIGAIVRNGSTVNHHLALWNGNDADSLEDGGVPNAGAGDVVGPSGAVDSNMALFDTTTGKLIKDGGAPFINPMTAQGDIIIFSMALASQNVALASVGSTITVDSTSHGNKDYIIDGDLSLEDDYNHSWRSNSGFSGWFRIDLGSIKNIANYRLHQWDGNFQATHYHVQTSPDDSNWTTVYSKDSGVGDETIVFPSPIESRYWRFLAIAGGYYDWVVFECQLWTVPVLSAVALPAGNEGDVLTMVDGEPAWIAP